MLKRRSDSNKDSLRQILGDSTRKGEFVHMLFDSIAKDYDKLNTIISFGQNIRIKKQLIRNVPLKPDMKILDVCTGTGDIAIFLAQAFNDNQEITGLDLSDNMLDIARRRARKYKNIKFIKGDALNLPFEDETFDVCFVGYGLRNLTDLRKGVLEMKRVTKQGGYVVNLDLGKPKGLFNKLFRKYFFGIVPLMGKIFHGNSTHYRYLSESNEFFPNQAGLMELYKDLGFSDVKNYNFMFGTIAQQIARK